MTSDAPRPSAFQLRAPPRDLARWIRLYWQANAEAGNGRCERVVPDGCCELVVHLDEPIVRVGEFGSRVPQPTAFVFGQIESALELLPGGRVDTVGVRFEPAGIAALWGLDPGVLGPREVEFRDLYTHDRCPPVEELRSAASIEERSLLLSRWLRGWLRRTERRGPDLAASAITLLERGGLRVDRLAAKLGCSRRSLERVFRHNVGLSPAQYQRLRRLNATLPAVVQARAGLAEVAALAGYSDQAHFSREFRAIVGTSPLRYRREQQGGVPLLSPA